MASGFRFNFKKEVASPKSDGENKTNARPGGAAQSLKDVEFLVS